MSLSSIQTAYADADLRSRVEAAILKEINYDEDKRNSDFGKAMLNNTAYGGVNAMYWAVAVATETAYESALAANRGAPGHDPDVITDGAITSAVTANWPADAVPPPTGP